MNKYYLLFKGTNKDLAIFEFKSLWKLYLNEDVEIKEVQNTLYCFSSGHLVDLNSSFLRRLTFTNYLGLELFFGNCGFEEYEKKINETDFSYLENKKFAIMQKVFGFGHKFESKEVARPIWNSLKNPKVDLENPEFVFYSFTSSTGDFILSKGIYFNSKEYLDRMPKLRPIKKPYTLKSDMARVCCNLLNLKEGASVLDPFAGIGGILLEAFDLGYDVMGNDISFNDLADLRKNFKHYFPKIEPKLTLCDSQNKFLPQNSVDGLVTDIPYGRSCRKLGVDLYKNFLESAKYYLKDGARMVVIFADFVEFEDLACSYFKKIKRIDQYINKSMTRHILVLENDKS